MSRFRQLFATVACLLGLAAPALAAAPRVDDRADFYSPGALAQANKIIQDIYDHTSPHKQVAVVTTPSLAPGMTVEAAADAAFREQRLDGVLLYLVRSPHRLVVTVGRHTQERFTAKDEVRDAMLDRLKRNDADGALLTGLQLMQRYLVSEFPAVGTARAMQDRTEAAYGPAMMSPGQHGGFGWLTLLIIAAGIFVVVRMVARRREGGPLPPAGPTGGYGPPAGGGNLGGPGGYMGGGGGSMGGGFGRSMLGGLLGSFGGNWLYDRFRGRDGLGGGFGGGYGGGGDWSDRLGQTPAVPPGDDGEVGSDSQGTWGDGGDVGGDSGGSDWSSGGDDSSGDW